ncbi:lysophospholipid acyltransferase family protein [Cesiribacter andamanensis]|uniref:2-acyl-glycerophospho-ethanolamine acyltransferase n=1 Tax=Cesiribacter andamanensis AMV16 TaxID=1279009 RepID=M7NQ61_9BACT|nr:lysophospholipid acyltransferase family protein [Cesiribacter andamanensis]EMR00664.1 2-acyl-glycerophospho-ethanolamine acyltransferase [Cesiribacter andamanensis AMV16]
MIRRVLHRIYSTYSLFMFGLGFLLLFPFFLLLIFVRPLRPFLHWLHWLWAAFFLGFSGVPWRIRYLYRPRRGQQYVICANHFSILDIVSMGLLPLHFMFVGKESLSKIPLFGYMFRKLHITVNRNSLKDRYKALKKSMQAIDEGNSLVMFPEGGVLTDSPPQMARFKEGPFRVAIEKQIPILPVTIPHNWIILPDDGRYLLYPRRCSMVVHPPIQTRGLTLDDIPRLQQELYALIDAELKKWNSHDDRRPQPAEAHTPGPAGA